MSICIRTHSPPPPLPLFERGKDKHVFRQVAYVPLSRIKSSCSWLCFCEWFTQLANLRRPFYWCRLIMGQWIFQCWENWVIESAGLGNLLASFIYSHCLSWQFWFVFFETCSTWAEWTTFFVCLWFAVGEVASLCSLCSARKQRRNCFWHPHIFSILFGVWNLTQRW